MTPARRSGFKWLAILSTLAILLILAMVWVILPGGVSTADRAAAQALRGKITRLHDTLDPANDSRTTLEQRADAIFAELMASETLFRQTPAGQDRDALLQVNALRALKLADLQRDNPELRLDIKLPFGEREADYLQHVVVEMIGQSKKGKEEPQIIEAQDLIDAGAIVQENGALGSLTLQTTPQVQQIDAGLIIDPTMPPIVIGSGGVANELEQLEPAARFLAVLNQPLWWDPVTDKLQEMLSPSQDVPASVRENWRNDLDDFAFPVELISSPEPFGWQGLIPLYLDRRLNSALNSLEQTASWGTMRDWLAARGSRNLPGQLIDGFFVKLRRKGDFRRSMDWIETVIQAAPGIDSFGDLAAIEHSAVESELPMLADIASGSIRQRLLAAAYLLRTGQIPANPAENPYFIDPYTRQPIVLEQSGLSGGDLPRRLLLVSVGPDSRPDTYRQIVKDDVVVDLVLDPGHPAWKLVAE